MQCLSIRDIAETFWKQAGKLEPFPRSLEPAVYWALPIGVFKLPSLWIDDVKLWLEKHNIRFELATRNRLLHGCLIANNGRGCILLNGSDTNTELRYSLAHEVSHFLLDYYLPRQLAVERLGPEIIEVFDAQRPPTLTERVHAVIKDVSIGFHSHLMERHDNGVLGCGTIGDREERADLLAIELLAPEREVRYRVAEACRLAGSRDSNKVASEVLQLDFGLPSSVAAVYHQRICRSTKSYSVREWLRQRR